MSCPPGSCIPRWPRVFRRSVSIFTVTARRTRTLAYGVASGIGCFIADNREELLALEKTAAGAGVTQAILLRVTPGIDPHTYEAVSTGKVDSKFGAAVETGQAMELVKLALAQPHLKLLGLHCHVGSQVFGEDVYQRTIDIMAAFLAEIRDETGAVLEELNLGGGYGVRYTEEDEAIDIPARAAGGGPPSAA